MTSGKALSDLRVRSYLFLGSIYFFTLGFLLEVFYFLDARDLFGALREDIVFTLLALYFVLWEGARCHQCGFWREGGSAGFTAMSSRWAVEGVEQEVARGRKQNKDKDIA